MNWIKRYCIFVSLFVLLLTGCSAVAQARVEPSQAVAVPENQTTIEVQVAVVTDTPEEKPQPKPWPTATVRTGQPIQEPTASAEPTTTPAPTATEAPALVTLDPETWKEWPVLPVVSPQMRQLYQDGLAAGNDPRAFSILGDCQSQPDVFMGVFDSDPEIINQLPANLQETVANFSGSFDRYSPTVKDGTTEGALLWIQWNDNKEKKCEFGETPLDCELRVHKPSIVFVHVGTHWEKRTQMYFDRIIQTILDHKAVPILVTKADNRELDERINHNYAVMAAERGLPLWNFWATVQHLPGNGMEPGSAMYLTNDALIIHRQGALEALDAVWRAVQE